jgi:photosystem II stability/assembly factor-like uncharacterized protein
MQICVSHGGQTQFRTDQPADEVLVATANGVAFIARSGNSWSESRRALEGNHISALVIEPSRGTIFAGTHGDGIYASADGGRTWDRRDAGVVSPNIYSLAAAQAGGGQPNSPTGGPAGGEQRIYAGTEPAHLHVSTDLGQSWTELPAVRSVGSVPQWTFPGAPHEAHVKHITFDPRSADTIYTSIEVGGALKSIDGGRTFRDLHGMYEDVHRMVVVPTEPSHIYISGGDGLWESKDSGETWARLTDSTARIAYPDALLVHPETPELMFMAGAICSPGEWRKTKDADSRIGRSRDGGRTWEYLEGGLPAHIRGNMEAMTMNSYPGGFALFAGTTDGDVYCGEDEGARWTTIASGLPPVSKGGHYRNLRDDAALVGATAH